VVHVIGLEFVCSAVKRVNRDRVEKFFYITITQYTPVPSYPILWYVINCLLAFYVIVGGLNAVILIALKCIVFETNCPMCQSYQCYHCYCITTGFCCWTE